MLRELSKRLIGKRPENMRVSDYYKIVGHVERKIKEAIITTVLGVVVVVALILCFIHGATGSTGYYAPDYMDSNGVLYDTDGDGDYYHWVEE